MFDKANSHMRQHHVSKRRTSTKDIATCGQKLHVKSHVRHEEKVKTPTLELAQSLAGQRTIYSSIGATINMRTYTVPSGRGDS